MKKTGAGNTHNNDHNKSRMDITRRTITNKLVYSSMKVGYLLGLGTIMLLPLCPVFIWYQNH
ncbi:MAG: hypothetical protein H7257_07400 [Taibaiella sp.]|nr:hypothetical protein [Taibaiella sp.]